MKKATEQQATEQQATVIDSTQKTIPDNEAKQLLQLYKRRLNRRGGCTRAVVFRIF